VEKFEEAFGDSPDVAVAHGEGSEAGSDDYDSFGEFNGGNGAHAFDVSGVVDVGMRDYGMHLMKIDFRVQRLTADSF
jgi:hypothetical protein